MKRLFLALSALALTAACSQDELMEEAQPTSYDLTVTATMPEADTRTYVDGTTVYWYGGEQVVVVSKNNEYFYLQLKQISDDKESATFSGEITCKPSELSKAYYVHNNSFASNITFDGTTCTYSLKDNATYTYQSGLTMESCSPMSATLNLGDTEYNPTINFQHEAAMIRILLKNIPAQGDGTLTLSNGKWSAAVVYGNEDEDATTMTFDIPIPVGDYTYTATIEKSSGTATIGTAKTTATNPDKGQILYMGETDYNDLKFTSTFTLTGTTTDYSNPQSEVS